MADRIQSNQIDGIPVQVKISDFRLIASTWMNQIQVSNEREGDDRSQLIGTQLAKIV